MQSDSDNDGYALLDSGDGRKLERFGPYVLSRPASQAVWRPQHRDRWDGAAATFDREKGMRWQGRHRLPPSWTADIDGIRFKLSSTDFGHLGVFPEQRAQWQWLRRRLETAAGRNTQPPALLNLFAYSGGMTLAAAQAGAGVCHLDASRGMVEWARENASLNKLDARPIRWIVDDVIKFLARELRRGRRYDAVVLDPPTYGRGKSGEVFKIEEQFPELLDLCRKLLSPKPDFVLLTCHTPDYSPLCLANLMRQVFGPSGGTIEHGELLLTGADDVMPLPNGVYARCAW